MLSESQGVLILDPTEGIHLSWPSVTLQREINVWILGKNYKGRKQLENAEERTRDRELTGIMDSSRVYCLISMCLYNVCGFFCY